MKIKFVLIIVCIALFNASVLYAAAFSDNDINVTFPEQLGTLEFHGQQKYPEKGLGYSLRYDDNKLFKVDVYVYDENLSNIGNSIDSKEIIEEFDKVLSLFPIMEKMGKYKDVRQLDKGTVSFFKGERKFLWSSYQYSQLPGGGTTYLGKRISETYLTAKSGKYIKVRLTLIAEEFKEKQKAIKEFMEEFSKVLEK